MKKEESARNARVARSRRRASMGCGMLTEGGMSREVSPALTAVPVSLCELSDLCERRRMRGGISRRGAEVAEGVKTSARNARVARFRRVPSGEASGLNRASLPVMAAVFVWFRDLCVFSER